MSGRWHDLAMPADPSSALVVVDDPGDPRLADYVGLTDPALRRRALLEGAGAGLFIAEGELVIRRALEAGYRLRSLLLLDARLAALADLVALAGRGPAVPVYAGSAAVLEAVTGFNVHRGALAAVARPPERDPATLLEVPGRRRLVVLEDVNNHTNLGAVARTAAALGWDGLLLDPRSVDPLYRRTVRVSMGAVFRLPYARLAPWPDALGRLGEAGFELLALTPDEVAEPLGAVAARERVALLLGAEGPGLSAAALAAADRLVRIPMSAGIDSLNVAAAAAVACWELR